MPQNAAPNIVVIMGDDIGWFNLGSYHQGMKFSTYGAERIASARQPTVSSPEREDTPHCEC